MGHTMYFHSELFLLHLQTRFSRKLFICTNKTHCMYFSESYSSVNIVTRLQAKLSENASLIPDGRGVQIFLFSTASKPALRPMWLPIQRVLEGRADEVTLTSHLHVRLYSKGDWGYTSTRKPDLTFLQVFFWIL
jgi:hypothetical protein